MDHQSAHSGVAPHGWLQRHVPWLGLLALVMALFSERPAIGFDPDDLNG